MNLLVISNNPDRGSFRQRIAIHLDNMRAKGIFCHVAKLPPGTLARRNLLKQSAYFDCVFIHKKRLSLFDAIRLRRYGRKIIYDFDDAVMYRDSHPERPSRKRQRSFRRTVRLADLVIAGNDYLSRHAREFTRSVNILPTGLDTGAYEVQAQPPGDGKIRLVWIGSKSTLPYLSAIRPVIEEIAVKFDKVVLRIICDDFFDLANAKVEKRPWSEQSQVQDLLTSDIGLAPLPDDRFTRGKCGFKLLQYAAAGLPAVTSPVGVNAEYVTEGVTGFHATNSSEWVSNIGRLIESAELRRKMGRQARLWVKSFDVEVIGKRLIDMIQESVKSDDCHDKDRP
ncbi:MAG TPA: glycosyltransferase family 4 protein [Sedimentisphaerales bacterium]|nr:glycosyltransferase family 4 protein [Sedimentisphaerales bacterium]